MTTLPRFSQIRPEGGAGQYPKVNATEDGWDYDTGASGAPGDLHLIERLTLTTAANSIAFATNPLPTSYKNLRIVATGKKASSDSGVGTREVRLKLNSGLTVQYTELDTRSDGTAIPPTDTSSAYVPLGFIGGDYGTFVFDIIDYNALHAPPAIIGKGWGRTSTAAPPSYMRTGFGQVTTQTAITSLTLILGGSVNFVALDAMLYGLG